MADYSCFIISGLGQMNDITLYHKQSLFMG